MSASGTGLDPRHPRGNWGDPSPASRAWEMGEPALGTVRGFNEPPNPLILFLAREMGLLSLSPSRLRWGEETVGKRVFQRKWGVLRSGGSSKPGVGGTGCW